MGVNNEHHQMTNIKFHLYDYYTEGNSTTETEPVTLHTISERINHQATSPN